MFFRYLFIGLFALFLLGCSKDEGPVSSMQELKERVDKINDLNKQADKKRGELFATIREFNKNRPENEQYDIAKIDTMLGESEQELLRTMFKNEQDITYKGLLKNILDKNAEIGDLRGEIADLYKQLPKPYLVKQGDTQYEIVMDFLVKDKGLSIKEAEKVAMQTAMVDDILPGNQVWLLFYEGNVGTYVTQGKAYMSPLRYQVVAKKQLIEKSKALGSREASTQNSKTTDQEKN